MANREDAFTYALSSNQAWAAYKSHQNPTFFEKLASGQSPQILWLGCSDSRVPETTILSLQPGDVFVHRNIANIISPTDINTSAVIQFAVDFLKVRHVVLCGHSSCGGAAAALADGQLGGVLDTWLTPLKAVRNAHADELASIADTTSRTVRMAELNVEQGVQVLLANPSIAAAVKKGELDVHGVFYDIPTGKVRHLGCGTGSHKHAAGGESGRGEEVVRGKHARLVFRSGGAGMSAV